MPIKRIDYTLADVYDDAAIIGSELEKIITNYGADVIKDLMPKVISVLELLEDLTIRNEKENDEINELKMRINGLEAEKTQRINEREKFEKELEEIEEKWKSESLKLIDMVNKLKDENKRLNESLAQNNSISVQNEQLIIKQEELDYIRQIKEENIKLKEAIRFRDKELEQKMAESDALHGQVDSLTNTMVNFRRKQIVAQNQIEKMVKAKAELECSVTEKEHQLNLIKEKLHMKNIQTQDRSQYIVDLDDDKQQQSQSQLQRKSSQLSQSNSNNSTLNSTGQENGENFLIIDAKDPNRPRFTLNELQKVLMEKNQLTVKLDQTKDELEHLRRLESMSYGEVQGPINKEPEEKLDPNAAAAAKPGASSGIRRFFSFFLNASIIGLGGNNSDETNTSNVSISSLTNPSADT